MTDMVNRPAHYTRGKYEAIDVIEDAVIRAPDPVRGAAVARAPDPVRGALQWQTLKYTLRLWDKGDPLTDAKKARWYLDRLINQLESNHETNAERPNPYVPSSR